MNYYVHALDPMAFRIGNLVFPWYWLVYFGGYFWLLFGMEFLFKRGKLPFKSAIDLYNFLLIGFLLLIVGGRLGYVFIYNFSYYLKDPVRIFYLWEGGMSFHGALIATGLWTLYFSFKKKISFFKISDALSLFIPPVLACGRVANFINGELAGRVTDVSWAVIFPRLYDNQPRHPSQLYEAILEGVFVWIAVALVFKFANKKARPTGVFIFGYGLSRFIVEFFREPDRQLGFIIGELTMGQLLCIVMMLVGAGVFYLSQKESE